MTTLHIHQFSSSIGQIRLAATEKGLAILTLPNESAEAFEHRLNKFFPSHEIAGANETCLEAERQIQEYLDGKRKVFSVSLDIQASPFYVRVLHQVAKIPYGQTSTYGEIARAVGNPGASRAVGSANARNNLPLIIPCHRVLASNGMGGYGGTMPLKLRLLKLEGALGS